MNKERMYQIIRAPRLTEKTTRVGDDGNQYVFQVATDASKPEIKGAIEGLFDVTVEAVRVLNVKGKEKSFRFRTGRRKDWKKAYVRVAEGQSIDVLESEGA